MQTKKGTERRRGGFRSLCTGVEE